MKKIRMGKNGRRRDDQAGEEFYECIKDLLEHPVVQEMQKYIQHGTTTCYQHCLNVAYYNFRLCRRLGLDARRAARAGMLHDLFLYDWHEHAAKTGDHFHGLRHPRRALENARQHFCLTSLEEDVILKHMWPLTVIPPVHAESFVICLTDKYCGFCETVGDRHRLYYRRFPLYRKMLRSISFLHP
ncbi:MAG: HD domain-containing protein [Lachnospiraceae bacterium]|nr:HD domain-containing protein [Lachnospiraceae bacterium]